MQNDERDPYGVVEAVEEGLISARNVLLFAGASIVLLIMLLGKK